jgi:hypothetical protein
VAVPDTSLDGLVGQDINTVSFVMDYVELRIYYSTVRALTPPSGTVDGIPWRFDEPGAADIMRRYIGKGVIAVELIEDERLTLVLDGGGTFDISLRPEDRVCPEAAHFVPGGTTGLPDVTHMSIW